MSGTTDFLYNTATDLSTLYTATTDGIAQLQQLPTIKDTMSSGQETVPLGNVPIANRPQLPTPGPNNPAGFDHALMVLTNFPEMVLGFMDAIPAPTGEDKFADKMDEMLGEIGQEKLSLFGGGDPKLGLLRVKYAVLHKGAEFPKEIKELAQQIREKASESAGYSANEFIVSVGDTVTPVVYRGLFEDKVRTAGLTETELKQVLFASDFPEAAATLPPKLQKILKEAEASALAQVSTDLGLPSDYQIPRNTAAMKEMLSEKLGKSVDDQLYGLMSSKTITRAEYNEMRTLLAMPGANTPHAEKLVPILQKLIDAAIGELKKDYGIPDNFPLSADGSDYQALLNGTYFAEFNKQLGNPSLNLTPNQQAQLKEALINKTAADALPPELKTIFENIKAATLTKVSVAYGLPGEWQPDINALSAAATRTQSPGFKAAQEGLKQGQEAYSTGRKVLKDLEDVEAAHGGGGGGSPITVLLKDYLKALSLVLITMQEILSKQSVSDSSIANTMAIVQRDEKIGELDKRQKELNEIIAKQKKMATLGPLKAIFQWLINIFLIMFLGPLGIMLLMNSVIQNMKKNGGKVDMGKMNLITDLGKLCQDIGKSIGGPFGNFLGNLMQVVSSVALMVLCPAALIADLMVGEATFLKQILTGLGVPKKEAALAAMAIQMVVMVVAMVALCVFTGGASIMVGVAKFAESCGKLALQVLKAVEQFLNWAGKYLKVAFEAIKEALGISPQVSANAAAKAPGILQDTISSLENFVKTAGEHVKSLSPQKLQEASYLKNKANILEENAIKIENAVVRADNPDGMRIAKEARAAANAAKDEYKTAMEPIDAATNFANVIVLWVQNTVSFSLTTVQTTTDLVKKSLEIQVVRIKAALEENQIIVEAFIKLIKALIAKLMETIKGFAEDIKETVSAHKKLFEGMSEVIRNLFA